MKNITIKGAKLHNLKNIDISIPKNKIVAVTGISGSGKSSLVFDIIFEEGRKEYLQSLGILAGINEENKFDSISGISPAIAVQQNIIRQTNSRSTVGTRTNILNLLTLLYSSEGDIHCYNCGEIVDEKLVCENCGNTEERLQASYFSYNSPDGMCLKCSGKGSYYEIDMEKLVPDSKTTLRDVFNKISVTPGYERLLHRHFNDHLDSPFHEIPDDVKEDVIYGHHVTSNSSKRSYSLTRIFQNRILKFGEDFSGIFSLKKCCECEGYRIGEEARRVTLNGKHIGQLCRINISELYTFLNNLPNHEKFSQFGKNILKEILIKIENLIKSRLGHLTLYRGIPTLSGGEMQRLFLNSHLESKMDSLIYIMDEPTAGLHESEKEPLIASIKALKEQGNTVIVVEHDKKTIENCEHIIDIGPYAGSDGGELIYQGDLDGLYKNSNSITGKYLSGEISMPEITENRKNKSFESKYLKINHAKTNNLKDITVSIPLGKFVGIAGVSGSGKSSLISDTLIPLLKGYFHNKIEDYETDFDDTAENQERESFIIETIADRLEGIEHISEFAQVTQSPIGRQMKSIIASYIGIWDKIRKLYSKQPGAVNANLSAGYFSFNSKGACSACGGSGREKIWLGGNLFIYNTCKECKGKRFNDETLSIKYKDKNIDEVLEMQVSDAIPFFREQKGIVSILKTLEQIGMGYIQLGQPAPTLSGGEAQRIKLAKEIGKNRKGHTFYVLDEPTTGLSPYDTAKLIHLLDQLVKKGNSVVVIEHDIQVLSVCDWIIELGPDGGENGGEIIAEGTFDMLKNNPKSKTGKYLK